MKNNSRKQYSPEFKTKVALEALSGLKTLWEIAQIYEISPILVSKWKAIAIKNMSWIFSGNIKTQEKQSEERIEKLYREVWALQVENTWLKKKVGYSP
jgi:transposase-like protein